MVPFFHIKRKDKRNECELFRNEVEKRNGKKQTEKGTFDNTFEFDQYTQLYTLQICRNIGANSNFSSSQGKVQQLQPK